jgi:hypothetical protein
MKGLISILVIVFTVMTTSAQMSNVVANMEMPIDEATGLITYKEVIDEPGLKDTLYNRASSWLHTFYPNPWDAAKVRDQSTGLIRIQHQFKIYDFVGDGTKTDAGMILYNAKIEFKDNRYRVQIDNFVYKQLSRVPVEKWMDKKAPDYNPQWESYLAQIDFFARNELIKSLKEKMKPGKVVKEEEW